MDSEKIRKVDYLKDGLNEEDQPLNSQYDPVMHRIIVDGGYTTCSMYDVPVAFFIDKKEEDEEDV